jgi:hypothetical protein
MKLALLLQFSHTTWMSNRKAECFQPVVAKGSSTGIIRGASQRAS